VLVIRWLDRLGRNYRDVKEAVECLMKRGVIIRTIINNYTFDGSLTDPMPSGTRCWASWPRWGTGPQADQGRSAGRNRARQGRRQGQGRNSPYRGRKPTYTRAQFEQIVAMADQSHATIAKAAGLPR
jgi:putative DNA-invertase from lambdoid prophage Rac